MHKLLSRQLRRCVAGEVPTPEEWHDFVQRVDSAYSQSDSDRSLLERSLELSSRELISNNETLRQDIKRREVIEEKLESVVAALQSTLDATIDGILLVGADRSIVTYNQRYVDMWRIPSEVMDGRSSFVLLDYTHQQTKEPKAYKDRVEALWSNWQELHDTTFDLIELKDGRTFERYAKPHRIVGKGAGIMFIFRDVTEKRWLEQQRMLSGKMAAIGQLAAGVAHEINNPLAVILGFSQGITKRLPAGSDFELPLRSIEREALRCKSLVQDLLTFSRAGREEFERINLNAVIESALSLIRVRTVATAIEFTLELSPNLPAMTANVSQIQQVVINLAQNAIDALGGEGKVLVKTEPTTIGLGEPGDATNAVCLTVTDNGSGIAPEVLPRIFEPFYTTKPVGKGTGLGLGIVHEIVQLHAGSIDVRSVPGHTEFRLIFPTLAS